jgi:hypothetical protein
MFRELMNFSYRRTSLQALGWYMIFLLIGLVVAVLPAVVVSTGATSFTEGVTRGFSVGRIAIIPYHIILGILLLWSRPKDVANIILALAGVLLSALLAILGGLIPLVIGPPAGRGVLSARG